VRESLTTVLLTFVLLALASSVCFAQGKGLASPDRKPGSCDYITQSDVEAILGTAVGPTRDDRFGCWFGQVGWQNEPPNNKSMRLNVWNWSSPQAKAAHRLSYDTDNDSLVGLLYRRISPDYGDMKRC